MRTTEEWASWKALKTASLMCGELLQVMVWWRGNISSRGIVQRSRMASTSRGLTVQWFWTSSFDCWVSLDLYQLSSAPTSNVASLSFACFVA